MNLNTLSLMATAPIVTSEDSRFQRFPKPSYLGYTFFFYWNAGKYLQEQYFIAASPQQTKNVNEKKARKKLKFKIHCLNPFWSLQSTVCKMYTFITEILESISKNTISSQLHLSEQTCKRRKHIQIWNGYYGSNIWYNLKICRLGYYSLDYFL